MRFFFLLIFSFNLLFSAANTSLEQQYRDAKIDFLKASLKDNDDEKITELQKIIDLGKKLKKDTRPDEKKLEVLTSKHLGKPITKNNTKSNQTQNVQSQTKSEEKKNSQNVLHSIKSVYTSNNTVIIDFNVDISQNDVKYFKLNPNPSYRDVFDINGYFKDAVNTKLSLDEVENIVVGQNQPNVLRIVFSNKTSPNITYTISKRQIIITVNGNSSNKKVSKQEIKNEPKQTSSQNKTNSKQNSQITTKATTPTKVTTPKNSINKTIVIDAGHGGDDVGAVGPNKRYEKVINLNVAKYLESILKQRGYKVYLTRSTDVFIKVMDRTVLANEKNADLFISIHTNSMPKEKANSTSGIETFFLSPARSERAKKVAALENKDDIREMNESSKSAFLESLNRPRITASHKFAIDVQSGLLQAARTKYKDVNDSGVKEGPFWVLVGAQMPSILIEVGFISHPEESRRLYEKDYQQLLANGIANGVDSYFSKNP
ncbi:N-acetylmuramoyl-L-alanine amidase [Aliarcobacter butzleri]|uniref:N-acetylmuramoyl-L-alanine amidase family protein n=1 Tax=Aliarcobacter butzleri TaxID=28197 RepID=UPI0021B32B3B|nr:N-acetylmuramoyl-L-alanine amidase [Aliarcobacter butzleri]MCT7618262.1 N-acetylmuramoyl-L-alanine amidase [Aliarcobacter butzleri]